MDHQEMEINELIDRVTTELKNARYSDSRIQALATVWNRLKDYMVRNGKTIFTAKNGMDFMEAEYGITVFNQDRRRAQHLPRGGLVLLEECGKMCPFFEEN